MRNIPKHFPCHHFVAVGLVLGIYAGLLMTRNDFGIGNDYFLLYIFLSGARLHLLKNGLFSLPYYTPVVGGGLPLYADPQSPIFSVTQIAFNLSKDPIGGIKLSFALSTLLAYFSCYFLLRHFKISRWIATPGGIIYAFDGFITSRWLVGHFTHYNYWEIPWLLLCLLKIYHGQNLRNTALYVTWSGILLSLFVYGADINSIYLSAILAATLIAVIYFVSGRPSSFRWKWLLVTALVPFAACLAMSKVVAVMDYLKQFPRTSPNGYLTAKALLWLFPNALFNPTLKVDSSVPYSLGGWYEYCNYIGITAMIFLVFSATFFLRGRIKKKAGESHRTILFFLFWLLATSFLVFLLIWEGGALFWIPLKTLPIIKSYHGLNRFLGTVPLPLILLIAAILDKFFHTKKRFLAYLFCAVWIIDILVYFLPQAFAKKSALEPFYFPKDTAQCRIEHWMRTAGVQLLDHNIGESYPAPPQFGYAGDNRIRKFVVDPRFPPTFVFPDGTFNVNDPVAMIYPDDVGRQPWSRITAKGNETKITKFLSFEDPGFYVPPHQKVANFISVSTYIIALFILGLSYVG